MTKRNSAMPQPRFLPPVFLISTLHMNTILLYYI